MMLIYNQAASRQISTLGDNLEIWPVGKAPVGHMVSEDDKKEKVKKISSLKTNSNAENA